MELEITWKRAIRIWWSLLWRNLTGRGVFEPEFHPVARIGIFLYGILTMEVRPEEVVDSLFVKRQGHLG